MRYSQAAHFTASPFHFHRSIWAWIPLTGKLNMWKLTRRRVGDILITESQSLMKSLSRKPTGPFSPNFPCKPCSLRFRFNPEWEWQVVEPQSSNRSVHPVFVDILEYWNYFTTFELGKVLKRSTWHLKATIRFGMWFGKEMNTESQFNHQKQEIIWIFLVYALARESPLSSLVSNSKDFAKRLDQETPGQGCWWYIESLIKSWWCSRNAWISYQILLVLQLATKNDMFASNPFGYRNIHTQSLLYKRA